MRVSKDVNLVVGLAVLAVALIVVLHTLDVIPEGAFDAIKRAWPALLVLAGLSVFLSSRLRFAGLLSLALSAVLAIGVAVVAFDTRAGQQRNDYNREIFQPIDANLNLLTVVVQTRATDVRLERAAIAGAAVVGDFSGSLESVLNVEYEQSADPATDLVTAILTVSEEQPADFPRLETIGRGTLQIDLPENIPLDVNFVGEDGVIELDMNALALERLNVDLESGSALVTLPHYDPLASADGALLGTLAVGAGSIRVRVPDTIAVQLELDRRGSGRRPEFDEGAFTLLSNGVLETRAIESVDIILRYEIVTSGDIEIIEAASAANSSE